ncbi:histidine phosphatase family protein [Streptomyces sp. NBC_01754]|uniref:histidine phosphatase family protein n=1 Tax=Streptomyces sp. NBC_01754 TaxID=2975930 RepID=UPI002DD827D2|nr:histidine phosphatase family protein [Streptomyces sp. NBC_01754]WSC91874.1 histidine phosphatase family protein [Streptomyces sp. NBC_01754]
MTSRVVLVSPATSPALREARFDADCSIDERGAARARAAAGSLPRAARVVTSPGARCRETAAELGLRGEDAPGLAPLDVGRWRGRTLDEVGAGEPGAVARWLTDPTSAPHGGEAVQDVCTRVGTWLDAAARVDGRTLAVVEPEIVRAAVLHALGLPAEVFWRLDVPPLTATELSGRAARWNLRLGRPLVAPDTALDG